MKHLAEALKNYQPKEKDNVRVPYLAGMNREGTEVYFDKNFPKSIKVGGKSVDPKPYVKAHEEVETALMKQGFTYQHAHKIATQVENGLVEADGHDAAEYEKALKPFINAAHADKAGEEPSDLNPKPYDDSHEPGLAPHVSASQK